MRKLFVMAAALIMSVGLVNSVCTHVHNEDCGENGEKCTHICNEVSMPISEENMPISA